MINDDDADLYQMIHLWATQHHEQRDGHEYDWTRCCDHAADFMARLARRAGIWKSEQNTELANIRSQLGAVSFMRAGAEVAEACLDLCIYYSRESRRRGLDVAQIIQESVLSRVRSWIWPIAAELELGLFWAARPFCDASDVSLLAWKLYVRLFHLSGFDLYEILRRQRQPDRGVVAADTGAAWSYRTVRSMADLALDESSGDHIERWPMSSLFQTLDALADEWHHTQLADPAIANLVARCLLRYAVLGYARSVRADSGTVHDRPEYVQQRAGVGASVTVAVHPIHYYEDGGSVLRDMLAGLSAVVVVDCRVAAGVQPTPLAKRLWKSMIDPSSPALFESMCQDPADWRRVSPVEPWDGLDMCADRCLAAIDEFLRAPQAELAESCFIKSGLYCLIQPGELWRFMKRWPDHSVTPINILNAFRERDLTLYRDKVLVPGVSQLQPLKSIPSRLPRVLWPLLSHLVWESARHMMRLVAIRDATEALPSFLVSDSDLHEPTSESRIWNARFDVWTRLIKGGDWDAVCESIASHTTVIGNLPPFPQLFLISGVLIYWNPVASACFFASDSETNDAAGSTKMPWTAPWWPTDTQAVMDLSRLSATAALAIWLRGRMAVVRLLLPYMIRVNSPLVSIAKARIAAYEELGRVWFGADSERNEK